jgi:hypothetical protein
MPLLGNAVLAVWNDVDPAIESDFNDWYLREHIPERLSVRGMNRGRRFRADTGAPRYMAFYEAASMDVLTQGPYREQLDNPTAWTQRIMPHFRFAQRGLCDVGASLGDGIGSAAAVMHLTPSDAPQLRIWIIEKLLPELCTRPHVVAAHLWTVAPGEPVSPTTALSQQAEPDRLLAWVVVVETADTVTADAIAATILVRDPKAHGAAEIVACPTYRLLYAVDPR